MAAIDDLNNEITALATAVNSVVTNMNLLVTDLNFARSNQGAVIIGIDPKSRVNTPQSVPTNPGP